ncbi:putative MFS family arabinose efflux permease [Streptomyces aurantiacus]|uniref:MFS transporter n=1 Tax=Streptomyces aurantiacus TaxID=47760 RepID=UPI00279312E2|nr:MFS transporter [Streptomyces aurantiacus]MDQ0771818.1 putative MFS family arabinose efflux permease [Streptomyces aurantiacus]
MPRALDDFRRAQLAIAALFCFLGFQYATWASRLPALKSRLGLSETEVGLLLMACGAGAAASFPLVAYLMKRLGSRSLSLVSALCLVVILLGLSAAPNYPVALLVICADGVAVGCLNVAMNAQGAALESAYQRTAMTQLHATFSGGSFAAALLASGMNTVTSSMAAHFAAAAVLLVLLLAYAGPRLLADRPKEQEQPAAAEEKAKGRRRGLTLPAQVTLWLGCAMVFGTVTEGAMNDWSALYMKDVADAPDRLAPLGIAVVSVMMVLARFLGDGWRSRWGDARVVRVGSAVAGTGLALALLVGGVVPSLIGFACVGLGIAAVTPCLYVAAAAQGSDALALVATMGTIGLLAGPAVIGFVAGASSLTWGMAVVAASALLVSLCTTQIRWNTAKGAVSS